MQLLYLQNLQAIFNPPATNGFLQIFQISRTKGVYSFRSSKRVDEPGNAN